MSRSVSSRFFGPIIFANMFVLEYVDLTFEEVVAVSGEIAPRGVPAINKDCDFVQKHAI